MMSSEERKQIVGYLYRLIKESPLFTNYTDERIKEAAVRAELKAYNSSTTKDEYLRAMNSKIERIKNAARPEEKKLNYHTGGAETCFTPYPKEEFRKAQPSENLHYGQPKGEMSYPKQEYRPVGRSHTGYGGANHFAMGKQPIGNSSNLHSSNMMNGGLHNNSSNLHNNNSSNMINNGLHNNSSNNILNGGLHNNSSNLHSNSSNMINGGLHNNSNIHSINLHNSNLLHNSNNGSLHNNSNGVLHNSNNNLHKSNSLHNINGGFINQPNGHNLQLSGSHYMSPGQSNANYSSYKSFGEDLYGYSPQPTREYNNDGGFNKFREYNNVPQERPTSLFSNFNIKESNYYQPYNYERTSPVFSQQPINGRFRGMRPEAPSRSGHPTNLSPGVNDSFVFVNEMNGQAKSFGHSNGGGYITDRGFHSNKKLYDQQFVPIHKKPVEMYSSNKEAYSSKEMYGNKEAYGGKDMYNSNKEIYNNSKEMYNNNKDIYNNSNKEIYVKKDMYTKNDMYNSSKDIYSLNHPSDIHSSSLKFRSRYDEPPKTNPISTFSESRRVIYPQTSPVGVKKRERSLSIENQAVAFTEPRKPKAKKRVEIDETQANDLFNSIGTLFEQGDDQKKKGPFVNDENLPKSNLKSGVVDKSSVVENNVIDKNIIDKSNILLESKTVEKKIIPEEKVIKKNIVEKKDIPSDLREFIVSNKLNVMETSQKNVEMLKDSLGRCEETQAKALKIYNEHKVEFPTSKLHQAYTRTNELIDKQRVAIPHNVFFLTWRCVDDLLDNLKGTYIDMKVELENARKKVVNYPEAINNAFKAFSTSKKRDDDFVLDLRDN